MILDELQQNLLAQTVSEPKDDFILRGLWKIEMGFRPTPADPPFTDLVMLAQTAGVGYCACEDRDIKFPIEWIGRDVREIVAANRCLRIAILDAAYSVLTTEPSFSMVLHGSTYKKAISRASVITGEVLRLLRMGGNRKRRVAMVGAVGSILSELNKTGLELAATDMDASVIGKLLGGVEVASGTAETISMVESADLALVTGMTLSTNTLDEILSVCNSRQTRLVMFAQTGANFASEYVRRGVDTVVAESFPNYIFPGETLVRVFRSDWKNERRDKAPA